MRCSFLSISHSFIKSNPLYKYFHKLKSSSFTNVEGELQNDLNKSVNSVKELMKTTVDTQHKLDSYEKKYNKRINKIKNLKLDINKLNDKIEIINKE